MATAAVDPSLASSSSSPAPVSLSNIEAQWEKLSPEEQVSVHQQLETVQKKNWNELTVDEKKAAYYIAFGPHGPRKPISKPGDGMKMFLATLGALGVAGALSYVIRCFPAPEAPKTMTKEWQEAMNERALEQKMNPIKGIASEHYSGKGFVQSK
ncbi:cytochrome c oxidase subunit IV [Fistulina hepatica ATCC 64428]|uniref:Cytochrome c oxidase subunit IV n=1 Tax=Fistulina hepatica ATCC 64428 TaxID=1128425 RepID=A0A0D7A7G1_9AGAR|nr:cytochrome c oxidase subunit IV [Fistulina hepatica ATCC 64428]